MWGFFVLVQSKTQLALNFVYFYTKKVYVF